MKSTYQHYLALKSENPRRYARDLATMMAISEAELAHIRIGYDAKPMKKDFVALLQALHTVGETKSIVRNEYAVHEQVGRYDNVKLSNHTGLILNPRALDQRIFMRQWASAFLLKEDTHHGERQSIQIFDTHGDSVLKIYAIEKTNITAWNEIIAQFTLESISNFSVTPVGKTLLNTAFDAEKVEEEWRAMTDVHQFFKLLNNHNITRQQAFASVSNKLASKVENTALSRLLDMIQKDQNEIMIFIGNRGCVQIFTGVVEQFIPKGGWLNIFNADFTMHLMENKITETWITRKPTKEGYVTSLELFAEDGTQIAQLYGQRTEGNLEQQRWRNQIESLLVQDQVA
ncbi:hemin-degrading factor [Commensalibacter oyaizuii]|uniref:ChuX/HutX family heme-like substrate-binding protein n=1 Tax=Commensalibacter oyaizuii TaxID=3043873 RepID=A0ABT6Q026_9PROT|nr:ChuX/HutX family heme-like substrate-binding protein [Commensalibacter sp. TBRC 16381]MDI2090318.1 ChuX/HutX family heme-like substrate-binding protein [Commensalibacter sp. TBRC 16381]